MPVCVVLVVCSVGCRKGPAVEPEKREPSASAELARTARPPAKPAHRGAPSPEEIREEFRRIASDVKSGDNFYWGTAPLSRLRAELSRAPEGQGRLDLMMRVAWEELKLGDAEGAIADLEKCRAMIAAGGAGQVGGGPLDFARGRQAPALRKLGLAHLRAGENQNCVLIHHPDACIFPLGKGGIHIHNEHVTRAMECYRKYLELDPESRSARWLLNIAAMQAGLFPQGVPEKLRVPAELIAPPESAGRFVNIASDLEIHDHNLAGGAIVEDFDNDGFLDIMFSRCDPEAPLAYDHAKGDGAFEQRAAAAGLDVQLGGLNLMQTDYDNDGWPDVLVLRGGWQGADGKWRMSLLHNDGNGAFTDVTLPAGLASSRHPTQAAAWGDYDNDGDLDLYVGNEIDAPPLAGFMSEGSSFPSQLWRNNGDGTFTDVTDAAGVGNGLMCKGVAWGDYDDDGDPDLYVSNIGPNRLYRNQGDGTFRDVAPEVGVTKPVGRSFATWFWDYDNDGKLDIFVAGFQADVEAIARFYLGEQVAGVVRSKLYHNIGGGRFEEVSAAAGIDGVYLPMGANYGDLDNDGWLDFYLGTGDPSYETLVPNVMFWNDRGLRFEDVTFARGLGHLEKGHGIAWGDLDNDGDQDIVLEVGGFFTGDRSANAVFENPGNGNHWLNLKLEGTRSNRAGFGARVKVTVSEPTGRREIHVMGGTGGSFGASSLAQEIGLGQATRIESVEVLWPASGLRQRFEDVPLDAFLVLREGSPEVLRVERKRLKLGGASP